MHKIHTATIHFDTNTFSRCKSIKFCISSREFSYHQGDYRHTDCKPDNLWSNHLLKAVFLQKTHYFLSAQSPLHFPKPLHPIFTFISHNIIRRNPPNINSTEKTTEKIWNPAPGVLPCLIASSRSS